MSGMGFTAYTEREGEEKLRGVIPQHYLAYRIFKVFRIAAILFAVLTIILFILGFTNNRALDLLTGSDYYGTLILILLGISGVSCVFMLILYVLFLRKPPFDTWVYEVAQKRLGTEVIYYNSKCLYIGYDVAAAKEVDKRDFVTEMSDKSDHYSYFYVDTFVDQQIIQVECTRRQPIPERASFDKDDDLFWNIIPIGLTINNVTQGISPVGWWLNDNNKDERLVATVPSTSILIAGGPLSLNTIIPTTKGYKTMATIEVGDEVFDINNKPTAVVKVENINFNPTKVYKLVFNRKDETISIISDNIHRFPKIIDDRIYLSTTEELQIGDIIIDSSKYYNKDYIGWKLVNKFIIESEPVRCIAVNSEFHLFLITDKMNKNWKGGNSYPYKSILTKNTGCHIAGEEILMADGSIKKVEDIVVGDFVMGPDKKPREVLALHRGKDEMYEIESEDGNKHIVNSTHILHLINKDTDEEINISLDVYLTLGTDFQEEWRLMKI